ncbi:MAG: cysteine--tRNA ligase [Candidatus Tyloplasma litorale]|nr:MAG: cysteine--tRNA ligase [Mycoplasmatales bacterium]
MEIKMNLLDFYTKKEINFKGNVKIYLCGPTVYDEPHIGNMRPIIIFDVLNKVLSLKQNVEFIHNITDVDDKIINRSLELNIPEITLTNKNFEIYLDLLEKLNIKKPTYLPKVSEHIEGMIEFINDLIEKDYAYESNGSVYFSIKKFKNYGKLGEINIGELIKKSFLNDKEHGEDFVIWKKTNIGINWNSPWSKGRPGWHTECSYFIKKFFGDKKLDIHGGGIDLKFPHHINEMAQYEAYYNFSETSKSWIYVGQLNINSKKMSKSEGNFIKATDFINEYGANTLRIINLLTSYSKPINLTEEVINNAKNLLNKVKNTLRKTLINLAKEKNRRKLSNVKPTKKFVDILSNNLETPNAITFILNQIKILNIDKNKVNKEKIVEEIIANFSLLGIKFNILYNELKNEIRESSLKKDYNKLDELRERLVN